MTEEEKAAAAEQKPTGRAAALEMFRASNPDTKDDPEDEALFGFLNDKYGELAGANTKLADVVSKDPRLGAVLAMLVGEGKSLPYSIGKVFGKEWTDADPEEFEKGYQEHLAQLAESRAMQEQAAKNIEDFKANLQRFAEENGLDEAQTNQLGDAIYNFADQMLNGIIPAEFIDHIWKGMNYNKDVDEAATTGYVEGKNEAIDAKKKKRVEGTPLPDLAGGSGSGKPRTAAKPKQRGSFYDAFDNKQS